MKTFPMFLKMSGRRVVIVGGGEQAAQKARLVLKTEAQIVLLAQELDPELSDLVSSGRAQHVADAGSEVFRDTALVFVATGCKGADAGWHGVAKAAGAVVNVVDYPALCDAMTPSIVDRDPLVVAIGTEGRAPVLGRRIKRRMEEILHPRLGTYAALAGRLRDEVAYRVPQQDRRGFWAWVFGGAPWATFSAGHEQRAARQIKEAIQSGGAGETGGRLSFVLGVGEEADLLPLRAVQRLQEADTIFIDRSIPDTVLELARRDAERVRLGMGTVETSDGLDLAPMFEAAVGGARVVYLSTANAALASLSAEANDVPIEQMFCASD